MFHAYLRGRHSPDLVVVWPHENVRNALSHISQNPLIKVFRFGVGHTRLERGVDQSLQAGDLVILGQHGDVVLERVRHPQTLIADVGDTLVGVPVVGLREGLIDAVVEVLVVGEDDVPTDIVKL